MAKLETMTGSLRLIVALIVVLVGRGLFADDNDTQAAAEHFKKGVSLFKENKKDAAVKEFKTAFELKPSWKIMYNIGQCEASLKRYGMAIEAFEQYLGEGGDEVSVERRDVFRREVLNGFQDGCEVDFPVRRVGSGGAPHVRRRRRCGSVSPQQRLSLPLFGRGHRTSRRGG
jgi:tetratricopeptide (TPR) repeat protein